MTPARARRPWEADLATLVRLRDAPLNGPDPRAWADASGAVTIEVAFWAAPAARRRVLLHQGDLRSAALSPDDPRRTAGWSFALRGVTAEWVAWGPAGDAAWTAALGAAPWHAAAFALRFGADDAPPSLVRGWVDGRRLGPAPTAPQRDALGEMPLAEGLVLGGSRDRAGGHSDLRFGERTGEWVGRWRVAAGARARAPRVAGARGAGDALASDAPSAAGADRTGGTHRPTPTVTVDAGAVALRYRAAPLAAGDAVVWDAEDGLRAGAAATLPAAVVPAAVTPHWWPRGGVPRPLPAPPVPAGAARAVVFVPGDGGYAAFRIPAVARAGDGALLAFAEGRWESISDSCPTKHLVMRRSADEGASWSPLAVVASAPAGSLMNPSPVVSGAGDGARVVLVYSSLTTDEWAIAAGRGRAALAARVSDDHGRSWSDEIDVGGQLALPDGLADAWPDAEGWRLQVGTLGHALELRHGPRPGRLCFVGHGTFGASSVFDAVAYLFWSDDRGASWRVGPAIARRADGAPARGLNESTLAELLDGRLVVNSRHYRDGRPVGHRAVTVVDWDDAAAPVPGPVRGDPALVEPAVQASLLWLPRPGAPLGRLLFCNPAHPTARVRLTLRESLDGGATWTGARLLVAGAAGYSDLVGLAGGGVGVLFEDGRDGRVSFLAVR
ncbi:MAG: sialidase family protein [Trueperaceae bacterium]